MTDLPGLLLQWGPHRGPHGPVGPRGPMGPGGWPGAEMMPWGAGGTGLGLLWWILTLALLVAVVAAVAVLLLRLRGGGTGAEPGTDALDVLRRRYARGEIDDDEFDRRRTRLDGGPSS